MDQDPQSLDATQIDTELVDEGKSQENLSPGTAVGRYVILGQIGAGGMGFVYAAYDPDLDRKVALKLLRGDGGHGGQKSRGARRLVREAQAMAKLHHPNVVTVHDVGTYGQQVFFAMEFLDGRTLKEWIADEGEDWQRVLEVFSAAGKGLVAAHDVDLAHRDFKPENVMIDTKGRVVVLDFGLARADRAADSGERSPEPVLPESVVVTGATLGGSGTLQDLTRTGALVGTPAYMAPEQHLGLEVDARSDQFSFCVALYEGLFGKRPFSGSSVAGLAFNVTSGEVNPPPKNSPVPTPIRDAVMRGLSVEPGERWPSMRALLTELEPAAPTRRTNNLALVAGGGVVAMGAMVWLLGSGGSDPCEASAMRAGEVWNEGRRADLADAFSGIGLEFANRTWTTVDALVDAYVSEWVVQRHQACEDTRVTHVMSGEMMDLRNACLDRALGEVESRLGVLGSPDADIALRAVESVAELPSLERCADVASLRAALEPPADEAVAARVEQLRVELADARAHELSGRYAEGMEIATATAAESTEIEYCPLDAETLLTVGRLQRQLGDYEAAQTALEDAHYSATRCRHEDVALEAAITLSRLVGARLQRFDEGNRWARYGLATLERDRGLGSQRHVRLLLNLADVESQQGQNERALELAQQALAFAEGRVEGPSSELVVARERVGQALYQMGKYDSALETYERAFELAVPIYGKDHPRLGRVMQAIANVYADRSDWDLAIAKFKEVLALREAALGPEHADVASTLNDLGTVYYFMGRFDDALAVQERALVIREKALGPEHSSVGGTLNNLGNLYQEKGNLDGALEAYRRSLVVFEKSVGKEHRYTAAALNNIGILLDEKRRFREAIEYYERSLAIKRATMGLEHESNGATLQNIAAAYENLGNDEQKPAHYQDALSYYQDAYDVTLAALGKDHPALAYPLVGIGSSYMRMDKAQEARPHLERAFEIRTSIEVPKKEFAITQFHLSKALWDAKDQRGRARELLTQAHAALSALGAPGVNYLAEVDEWIELRHIRL